MVERVAIFVDYQNVYMGARRAFGARLVDGTIDEASTFGQVNPRLLGRWLVESRPFDRELVYVQLYRGLPSSTHDPKGYGATRRQVDAWNKQDRVRAITKPLRYTNGRSPQEKGVDVALAVDLVMGARDVDFQVAVVFSADTDLVPALDAVMESGRKIEVATWQPAPGQGSRSEIRPTTGEWWSHRMRRADYDKVCDHTDYNVPTSS